MYHYHGYGYINQKLLKTLPTSGGADVHSSLTLIAISGIVFIICQLSGVNAFAFFTQIGKWNAPTVDLGYGLKPTYFKNTHSRPGSTWAITRPTAMPHQEFVGLMKE